MKGCTRMYLMCEQMFGPKPPEKEIRGQAYRKQKLNKRIREYEKVQDYIQGLG